MQDRNDDPIEAIGQSRSPADRWKIAQAALAAQEEAHAAEKAEAQRAVEQAEAARPAEAQTDGAVLIGANFRVDKVRVLRDGGTIQATGKIDPSTTAEIRYDGAVASPTRGEIFVAARQATGGQIVVPERPANVTEKRNIEAALKSQLQSESGTVSPAALNQFLRCVQASIATRSAVMAAPVKPVEKTTTAGELGGFIPQNLTTTKSGDVVLSGRLANEYAVSVRHRTNSGELSITKRHPRYGNEPPRSLTSDEKKDLAGALTKFLGTPYASREMKFDPNVIDARVKGILEALKEAEAVAIKAPEIVREEFFGKYAATAGFVREKEIAFKGLLSQTRFGDSRFADVRWDGDPASETYNRVIVSMRASGTNESEPERLLSAREQGELVQAIWRQLQTGKGEEHKKLAPTLQAFLKATGAGGRPARPA